MSSLLRQARVLVFLLIFLTDEMGHFYVPEDLPICLIFFTLQSCLLFSCIHSLNKLQSVCLMFNVNTLLLSFATLLNILDFPVSWSLQTKLTLIAPPKQWIAYPAVHCPWLVHALLVSKNSTNTLQKFLLCYPSKKCEGGLSPPEASVCNP